MKKVIDTLNEEQLCRKEVQGEWSVKDILAHISAWNWDIIKQIEVVLANDSLWYRNIPEVDFNKSAVSVRMDWTLERVLDEWEESFNMLIARIKDLTPENLAHSNCEDWGDGTPVTVESLFGYRYKGEGHEGGHAKIVKDFFGV